VTVCALLGAASATFAQAQTHPNLGISQLDRNGLISWTNSLCAVEPVYELLKASSPTGMWQHVSFVTNNGSLQLTNIVTAQTNMAFYKLRWVSEGSLAFNYEFDEGYGWTAVMGVLRFGFNLPQPGAWPWHFEDVGSLDGIHPTGDGAVTRMELTPQGRHRVWLIGPPEGVYLEGTLVKSPNDCSYTRYSGSVYLQGFAGPSLLGTFTAFPVAQ
jgi:hypothetical protein